MIDYGTRQTDLAVRRAEWRLSRVYRQAQRDIDEKLKEWQKRHEEREAKYRQQLADGRITQADFDAWMRGQVFQDKQWQARKAEIDRILLNADREAQRIVNEGKIGVFADNANYIGYDLERNGKVNTGFTLYDQNTVGRLIKSDPQILPKPAPGVQKDKAYTYYNKLMNSAITQGIVQGETIPQIAKRIVDVTGERSYSSAVRNARTAYTGAQNAGRIEGMHQAQRLGVKMKKRWLATLDMKTRDSHAALDGQVQEVDDPFISPLGNIMYPGDPNADDLADVYNCRCTLIYDYPEYPSDMQRRDNETGEIVGDMTYREWEEEKRNKGFTNSENDSKIKGDSDSDESITGSRQAREKSEKVKSLENAGENPVETAQAVNDLNRIQGRHTRIGDCEKTNPKYLDGNEWQQNCQRCCATFEARRRGFDVTAKPLIGTPFADEYARGVMGYTKFYQRGERVPVSVYRTVGLDRDALTGEKVRDAIGQIMDGYGNGSRAIINGFWKSGGDGHVFIAENIGGQTHFYDTQSGDMNYSRPFDNDSFGMDMRTIMIFRIDDLPFAEEIRDAVSNV